MEQEVAGKTNNTGNIILVVVAVLLISCCACSVGGILLSKSGLQYFTTKMLVQNPVEIRQIADQIMDYELPPGFSEQAAVNLFGLGDMVMTTNSDGSQVIAFIQMNSSVLLDSEQIRQQMMRSMESSNTANFELVDSWTATIRDQNVVVQEFKGDNNQAVTMRQLTTVFEGKSGSVFLIVTSQDDNWRQEEIETFFASIE